MKRSAKLLVMTLVCVMIAFSCFANSDSSLPVPVPQEEKIDQIGCIIESRFYRLQIEAEKALRALGAKEEMIEELSKGVALASVATDIPASLLVVIIKEESSFNPKARNGNCRGLMQTPYFTGYVDVDILCGARILKTKLGETNGNLREALAMYKGGRNPVARRLADKTLKTFAWVKTKIGEV